MTRQEAAGREWAEREHPDMPVLVFSDNNAKGIDMDRPGWQAFTKAVGDGRIDAVWAWEQSRLTRAGVSTWDDVCELLTAAGLRFVTTTRQGRVSIVMGDRIGGRLNAVVDQHERELAIVRSRDGFERIALEGRPTGVTGYGYRRSYDDTGRPFLTPDPEQAPLVRQMVESVVAGDSLGRVAADLNARGIPTAAGAKVWRRESVRAIVTAPRIVGDRVHQGKVVGPAAWPPIVDRDLWDRAQRALHQPGRRTAGTRRRYLLSGGLAVCGECGTALISHRYTLKNTNHPGYACPHPSRTDGGCGHCAILAKRLEEHVLTVIAGWLKDPAFREAMDRHLAASAVDVAPLRAELAEVEQQLVTEAERWAAGGLLEFEHAAARRVLLDRRAAVLTELDRQPVVEVVTSQQVATAWRNAAKAGDVERLRAIIAVLGQPVTVASANRDGRRLSTADRTTVIPSWG